MADVDWLLKQTDAGRGLSGVAGLGDPKGLGKKYREEREIEVAPVHVSEADS